MNKKAIIIIVVSALVLLATAPWMNNKSIQNDILQKYGKQDGSIDKNGNLFCDYEAMWLPFGRWVVSCEGGYFVPFFYFKKGNNDNAQKQQIHENNKVETKTASWKTYRNEKYGFEVKYPNNYETIDQLNDGGQLNIKPVGESEFPLLSIEFIYNQDKNFLENDSLQRLSDVNKYRKVIDEQVKVGGFEGRMIGNSGEKDTEENFYREVFIDLKEKILFIRSGSFDDKIFNQILSTFKFTK